MRIYNNNNKEFNYRSIDKLNRYSSTKNILKHIVRHIYRYKVDHAELKCQVSGTGTLDNIAIIYYPLKRKNQFDIRIQYIHMVTYRKRIVPEPPIEKFSTHYKYMTLFLGWERKFEMYKYNYINW